MPSTNNLHFSDFVDFVVKRKELFVIVFLISLVMSYGLIFFLIGERFDATATIIPRQDMTMNLASTALKGLKGIPLNLGGGVSASDQMDLYKTIIYSRTMLESVVRKFNLVSVYGLDTTDIAFMEKALKRLKDEIETKETEESAFTITVRARTRQMSADMTNYIVRTMNDRIVELQVSRSRDNRIFLENRVHEIYSEIRIAEDSLRSYQERTGMLDVKSQLEGILKTHASLETDYVGKQLQLSIMRKMMNGEAPPVKELEIQVEEYAKRLRELRSEGDPGSPLLPLKSIPIISAGYVDRYREVEIDNLLLEFVMPLYEQAKIEEKKDYPVLQVIDYAVPPAKKSYPPRTLLALLGAFSITLVVILALMIRLEILKIRNPLVLGFLNEMKHWDWKMRSQ